MYLWLMIVPCSHIVRSIHYYVITVGKRMVRWVINEIIVYCVYLLRICIALARDRSVWWVVHWMDELRLWSDNRVLKHTHMTDTHTHTHFWINCFTESVFDVPDCTPCSVCNTYQHNHNATGKYHPACLHPPHRHTCRWRLLVSIWS